jgi:hypothetical protein
MTGGVSSSPMRKESTRTRRAYVVINVDNNAVSKKFRNHSGAYIERRTAVTGFRTNYGSKSCFETIKIFRTELVTLRTDGWTNECMERG